MTKCIESYGDMEERGASDSEPSLAPGYQNIGSHCFCVVNVLRVGMWDNGVTGKGLRKGKGAGISGKEKRIKKEGVSSEKKDPETGVDSTKRTTTNQVLYKYKSIGV
ncbi:hypothetical protein C8J57DRAFT_1235868 [Mycena rebaudengoi]|nr:hypothetical protein C8J57DRAFT_1235868 [Mycena rebaudengoi]